MIKKSRVKTKIITLRTYSELVQEAKRLGINISASLHEALKKIVEKERDKHDQKDSTAA